MPDLVPSKYCVRTSGCRAFRRCMRKWGFASSMKRNLTGIGAETNINFWFGTAIHWALEDYLGYNKFGDPREALKAYYEAFDEDERPVGAAEHFDLGISMLTYFLEWYPKHNQAYGFETVWLNDDNVEVEPHTEGARPLVEEAFMLDLGKKVWVRDDNEELVYTDEELQGEYAYEQQCADENGVIRPYILGYDAGGLGTQKIFLHEETIKYHGTCDRIVRDKKGRWWILDWKTAKSADTNKLDTDDQITRYLWAMEQWFQRPIHGFIYFQMTKDKVKPPKRLKTGALSVDKKQKTTSNLLRKELIKDYGSVAEAPKKLLDFLNTLSENESESGDRFIRWDMVVRSKAQKESTYRHIMAEVEQMANPNLYMYPTPTRDCIWDCNFREACLLMDDGKVEEAEKWLAENFEPRPRDEDGMQDTWRPRIKYPDEPVKLELEHKVELDSDTAGAVLNLIMPEKYKEVE